MPAGHLNMKTNIIHVITRVYRRLVSHKRIKMYDYRYHS